MPPYIAKGTLQMEFVKILRWGDTPELSGRMGCDHDVLMSGEGTEVMGVRFHRCTLGVQEGPPG